MHKTGSPGFVSSWAFVKCVSQIPDPSMPPPEPVRPGEGEPCVGVCQIGLVCAFSEAEDCRICRPELAAGQTCYQRTVTVDVERAYVCTALDEEVFCNASQMCQVAGAIGSSCPRDADNVVHCVEGAGCDAEGTCQFPGGPGTPCLEASYCERCGEGEPASMKFVNCPWATGRTARMAARRFAPRAQIVKVESVFPTIRLMR